MNRASLGSARDNSRELALPELEGGPEMTIVAGFDVHRRQITFDALDTETGELTRGRIDATPAAVERWVARFEGREMQVALEACTGWLFVSRALERAGAVAHLAEPVETSALRGRKRRAKTDREDARWLRTLLSEGRLAESWIPPEHVRGWRSRARLRRLPPPEAPERVSRRPLPRGRCRDLAQPTPPCGSHRPIGISQQHARTPRRRLARCRSWRRGRRGAPTSSLR